MKRSYKIGISIGGIIVLLLATGAMFYVGKEISKNTAAQTPINSSDHYYENSTIIVETIRTALPLLDKINADYSKTWNIVETDGSVVIDGKTADNVDDALLYQRDLLIKNDVLTQIDSSDFISKVFKETEKHSQEEQESYDELSKLVDYYLQYLKLTDPLASDIKDIDKYDENRNNLHIQIKDSIEKLNTLLLPNS